MAKVPKAIVIGSGPAGCAAACALADLSIDVTVFERGQVGKDKTCGDALTSSAIKLLSVYGIDQDRISKMGGKRIEYISLFSDKNLLWRMRDNNLGGWVLARKTLDQELRDIALRNVQIEYETLVLDVAVDSKRTVEVSLRYKDGSIGKTTCDAVILATGANNILSEKFDISGIPLSAVAISVYAKMAVPQTLVFQFTDACRPGYGWVFPEGQETANIGVCVLKEATGRYLRALGDELIAGYDAKILGKWRGGCGRLWSGSGYEWHDSMGIVSCGDSAGLGNPFTGEGMTAALLSGEQAGIAVSRYLRDNCNLLHLQKYSQWLRQHFEQEYQLTASSRTWANLCGISPPY